MPPPPPPLPPPPRRAPSMAPPSKVTRADRFVLTSVIVSLGGVALLSQRLMQMKDLTSDMKVSLATADESLKAISRSSAVRPPSPLKGATTGGDDMESLAFASATHSRLTEEERKQATFYANLPEMKAVRTEVQKGSKDAMLQRYRDQFERQLAVHSTGATLPSRLRQSDVPPERHQVLLNPYSTVHRQHLSAAVTAPPKGSAVSPYAITPTPFVNLTHTSTPVPTANAYHTSASGTAPSQQSASYGGAYSVSPHIPVVGGRPAPVYGGYSR